MKNSQKCPKCKSSDIVRIPGDIRGYGAGNNIRIGWTNSGAVKVTRYLCGSCGFSEEWIDDASDTAKIKTKYATCLEQLAFDAWPSGLRPALVETASILQFQSFIEAEEFRGGHWSRWRRYSRRAP